MLLYFLLTMLTLLPACRPQQRSHCTFYRAGKHAPNSTLCRIKVRGADVQCEIDSYGFNNNGCAGKVFTPAIHKELSTMKLENFVYNRNALALSTFNISFSDIQWRHLTLRFMLKDISKVNYCQTLRFLHGDLPETVQIYLDCPLFKKDFEGHDVQLDYTTQKEHASESRRLVFPLIAADLIDPGTTPLKDWIVFIYVDVTEVPKVRVLWQEAPAHFKVQSYIVSLINNDTATTEWSEKVPAGEQMVREMWLSSGTSYYFTVQLDHEACGAGQCVSSSTLISLVSPSSLPYIIGGVIAICLSILACVFYGWCVWQAKVSVPPVVLVIYKRSLDTHVKAVLMLADYLRTVHYMDVRIDEVHIPLSANADPFLWCQNTFSRADAVMVVSSPLWDSSEESGIYRGLAEVGKRLLAENYSKDKKFVSVLLPYCEKTDIPPEAKNVASFTLMTDMDKLVWYVHHSPRLSSLSRILYLLQPHKAGNGSNIQQKKKDLLQAFHAAGEDARKAKLTPETRVSEEIKDTCIPHCLPSIEMLATDQKIVQEPPNRCLGSSDIPGKSPLNINELLLNAEEESRLLHAAQENYNNSVNDVLNFLYRPANESFILRSENTDRGNPDRIINLHDCVL